MSNTPQEKPIPPDAKTPGFQRLATIVEQLRSPQGCPWDREQTPLTLRAALIEEAYEAVEAINSKDKEHILEELGDVYLMITMIAEIYQGMGWFTIDDVFTGVCEKLIRRHPHVYGDSVAENPEDVARQWQHIKEHVEGRKKDSVLDKVSHALPPLERAYQLQKKAAKVGFDWSNAEPVWDKITEELQETREAWEARNLAISGPDTALQAGTGIGSGNGIGSSPNSNSKTEDQSKDHLEEELGDLLFSVVNVARFLKIDPAIALQRSNAKFDRRFRFVEKSMKEQNVTMGPETFASMDALWNQAKKEEFSP